MQATMRECVCRGFNENCFKCGGRGWLTADDDQPEFLPAARERLKNTKPRASNGTTRVPKNPRPRRRVILLDGSTSNRTTTKGLVEFVSREEAEAKGLLAGLPRSNAEKFRVVKRVTITVSPSGERIIKPAQVVKVSPIGPSTDGRPRAKAAWPGSAGRGGKKPGAGTRTGGGLSRSTTASVRPPSKGAGTSTSGYAVCPLCGKRVRLGSMSAHKVTAHNEQPFGPTRRRKRRKAQPLRRLPGSFESGKK